MALKMSYEATTGITSAEAYWMVTDIQIGWQLNEETDEKECVCMSSLVVFADADAREAEATPIGGGNANFIIDMDGAADQFNIVKTVYEYVKAQDEFSTATDV